MGRTFKTAFGLGLCLSLLTGSLIAADADVIHMHNGKVVRGKIHRVTGDIIEFKPDLWNKQNIQRLTMTNRRDVIELIDNSKYFGEILYIDAFRVEVITAIGKVKLNRFLVKNIVLGSPDQNQMNDFAETVMQQTGTQAKPIPAEEPGFHNVSYPGATGTSARSSDKPVVRFPVDIPEESAATHPAVNHSRINPTDGEDMDSMPADMAP